MTSSNGIVVFPSSEHTDDSFDITNNFQVQRFLKKMIRAEISALTDITYPEQLVEGIAALNLIVSTKTTLQSVKSSLLADYGIAESTITDIESALTSVENDIANNIYNKSTVDDLIQQVVQQFSEYYTKSEVNAILDPISDTYSKAETDALLQQVKQDTITDLENQNTFVTQAELTTAEDQIMTDVTSQVYTKDQIDLKLDEVYYNKTQVDQLLVDLRAAMDAAYAGGTGTGTNPSGEGDVFTAANYYTKLQVDDLLPDLTEYYTKSEVNTLIPDVSSYYTQEEVETLISAQLANYYTKNNVDTLFTGYYTKSEVDAKIVDAGATDMGAYYTKTEVDQLIAAVETIQGDVFDETQYYDKAAVDQMIANVPSFDSTSYYNKTEVDQLLANIPSFDANNYYNKDEIDQWFSNLSTLYYNKMQIDQKIADAGTFDTSNYYTKTEVDIKVGDTFTAANYYTKSQVDSEIINTVNSSALANLSDYYTKTQVDLLLSDKYGSQQILTEVWEPLYALTNLGLYVNYLTATPFFDQNLKIGGHSTSGAYEGNLSEYNIAAHSRFLNMYVTSDQNLNNMPDCFTGTNRRIMDSGLKELSNRGSPFIYEEYSSIASTFPQIMVDLTELQTSINLRSQTINQSLYHNMTGIGLEGEYNTSSTYLGRDAELFSYYIDLELQGHVMSGETTTRFLGAFLFQKDNPIAVSLEQNVDLTTTQSGTNIQALYDKASRSHRFDQVNMVVSAWNGDYNKLYFHCRSELYRLDKDPIISVALFFDAVNAMTIKNGIVRMKVCLVYEGQPAFFFTGGNFFKEKPETIFTT